MAGQFLLGIDNGGTVAKAALFSLDGREVAVAAGKTETLSPAPGWSEFDMDALWSAAAAAVREAIAKAGIDSAADRGRRLYGARQRDLPGRCGPASPSATRSSRPTRGPAATSNAGPPTGIGQAVRPKTMQSLWPGQPNALLAWLRDYEPEAYAKTRWVLMCKDFIRLRLTGQAAAELTDMSGTSLMDVGTAQYDPDILDRFGIERRVRQTAAVAAVGGDLRRSHAGSRRRNGAGRRHAGRRRAVRCRRLRVWRRRCSATVHVGMVLGTWGINQYVSRDAGRRATRCS